MRDNKNINKEYRKLVKNLESQGFEFNDSLSDESKLDKFEDSLNKNYKKKHGVVYTPTYIARSMVKDVIKLRISNEKDKDIKNILTNIKILDPCCGAGVFTLQSIEELLDIWKDIEGENDERAYKIIKNNIYFCDLDKNSVEITKHRLWSYVSCEVPDIKEFKCNGYCADFIDGNFKGFATYLEPWYKIDGGFSIEEIYTEYTDMCRNKYLKASNFANEMLDIQGCINKVKMRTILDAGAYFKAILSNGGFDIIVGNPPYVSTKDYSEDKTFLSKRFESIYSGNNDLCIYFIKRAYDMLNNKGVVSMITTNTWMTSDYAKSFREWLSDINKLEGLFDFVRTMPFKDAGVTVAISILSKHKENIEIRYNDVSQSNENLYEYINRSKKYNRDNVYRNGVIEFLSTIENSIQEKFEKAKEKYDKIEDYCNGFKVGLLTGNLKLYTNIDSPGKEFITDELRDKYPEIVKKAYKPYRNTGKEYWNILYIRSGDYKDINNLPEEVKEYLLENKREFENRDKTTIGDEWYSLKHGVNRVESGVSHGVMSAYKPLLIKEIDADSIVLDTTTIFTKINDGNEWLVDYINNKLIEALYNKCVKCLMYPNSSVPRKQSKELNDFPVVCKSGDTSSIISGFGLTREEVDWLLNWNEEAIK